MNAGLPFKVRQTNFHSDQDRLKAVRYEVFVVEQNVPAELEWAGDDDQHWHVLATDSNDRPIGTGRISKDGKIGRMAVVEPWRGKGVGSALLNEIVAIASAAKLPSVRLASQVSAIPFYERFGFVAQGPVFVEANIQHQFMVRPVN